MLGQLSMGATRRLNRHYQSQDNKYKFDFENWKRQQIGADLYKSANKKTQKVKRFSFKKITFDIHLQRGCNNVNVNLGGLNGNLKFYVKYEYMQPVYSVVTLSCYDKNGNPHVFEYPYHFGVDTFPLHGTGTVQTEGIPAGQYLITFELDKRYYNMSEHIYQRIVDAECNNQYVSQSVQTINNTINVTYN